MIITLYACKGVNEELTKETKAFVTEWQAVRYGKKKYIDNGKDFVIISARHTGYGLKQIFHGVPFWVEMFIKGFLNN